MELQGKSIIVTGSGRGIGEGIAVVLGREGANVVVMDRNLQDAQRVAQQIVSSGGKALPVEADVTKTATLDAMVAATIKQYDRGAVGSGDRGQPQGRFSVLQSRAHGDDAAEQGKDYQHRLHRQHPYGLLRQSRLHRVEAWCGRSDAAPCLGTG